MTKHQIVKSNRNLFDLTETCYEIWPKTWDLTWIMRFDLNHEIWPKTRDLTWNLRFDLKLKIWPETRDLTWNLRYDLTKKQTLRTAASALAVKNYETTAFMKIHMNTLQSAFKLWTPAKNHTNYEDATDIMKLWTKYKYHRNLFIPFRLKP